MFRVHDGFVGTDDGIHVLKENDPRQNGMRKAGFLRIFVVFAEISRGVKKLFWKNRCLDPYVPFLKPKRFSGRSRFRAFFHDIVQRGACGVQSAIVIFK